MCINNQRMNKPDKYSYVSHHHHLPLQVDGKAKKRSIPIKKEEYNGEQGNINQDGRALLRKKIANNIHDLGDMRSVLPGGVDRKRSRLNSIKTFNDNKENIASSGVEYLMEKTQSLKQSHHKERAHIAEYVPNDTKRPEKKHYGIMNNEGNETEEKGLRNHKQTVEVKIANDIYSNAYRAEREANPGKKIQPANMFRNGLELGLQNKRQKKVSQRKLVELIGSDMNKQKCLKEKRQDWRISNVTFF